MKRGSNTLKKVLIIGGIIAIIAFLVSAISSGPTNGWRTNFDKTIINMDEVISGGVPRDGIPPIDNPQFYPVASDKQLSAHSPVIALEINGDARAYPLEVLTRHEIVNDVVGQVPVAVTFCPLCNSAVVFDRRVDSEILRFGVSGNLRYSDLIMWDDATESWWQQLTGEAIVGDYSGYQLTLYSSQLVSFDSFRERYPHGKVLRGPMGYYGQNPYSGYDSSTLPFLFRGPADNRLPATERVLAARMDDFAVAYSFELLEREQVINDTVNGEDIVVFWQAGAVSALDAVDIDASRDVGMALMFSRRLDSGQILTFRSQSGRIVDNETGSVWNIFGEATEGPLATMQLRQLHAFPHFWFAWAAFYPDTALRQI